MGGIGGWPKYDRRMRNDSRLRRGLWLEYATLGWNVVGTIITLTAAMLACISHTNQVHRGSE